MVDETLTGGPTMGDRDIERHGNPMSGHTRREIELASVLVVPRKNLTII